MPNDASKTDETPSSPFADLAANIIIVSFFVAIVFGIYKLFIAFCNKTHIPEKERKNVGIAILVILFLFFYFLGLVLQATRSFL